MSTGDTQNILEIIDSANEILKTAKKGHNSIRGDNHYARKFVSNHANAKKAIQLLVMQYNSKKAKNILKKISIETEKFFDPYISEKERKEASKKILRLYKTELELEFEKSKNPQVSNDLFPLELLYNTRGYLEKIGIQAAGAFDNGWYDAAAVMIRRLLETLIIECFEAHKIAKKIKEKNGDFFYLKGLIVKLLAENGKSWNLSKNCRKSIPAIKKIGDQSAHSRFFTAKKPDIDKIKGDLRIVIEELLIISKLTN